MAVEFHLEVFDGPLDWLLSQIQKHELNIYDIPIARITEQFLEYIHQAEQVGLQDLSEFYKMAAELIWIKSQILLPRPVEFGEEYIDPREDLVERLLEYSKFRKYSELLLGNETPGNIKFERKPAEFILPFSDEELWEDVGVNDLLKTFINLLENYSSVDERVFNVYEEVSEKDKIALMNELLDSNDFIMFSDLIVNKHSVMHIICAFLAVLEAVKDKLVLVEQPEAFGDMRITKRPMDWNPNFADDNDARYDEMVKYNLADSDDFSVMTDPDMTDSDMSDSDMADSVATDSVIADGAEAYDTQ